MSHFQRSHPEFCIHTQNKFEFNLVIRKIIIFHILYRKEKTELMGTIG